MFIILLEINLGGCQSLLLYVLYPLEIITLQQNWKPFLITQFAEDYFFVLKRLEPLITQLSELPNFTYQKITQDVLPIFSQSRAEI